MNDLERARAAVEDAESNPSDNPAFADILEQRYGRRGVLASGVAVMVATFVAGPTEAEEAAGAPRKAAPARSRMGTCGQSRTGDRRRDPAAIGDLGDYQG